MTTKVLPGQLSFFEAEDPEKELSKALDEAFEKLGNDRGECHFCHVERLFTPEAYGCCYDCYGEYFREESA